MASINTVSIELELKGQQEVTRGLKNLAKAQEGLDRGIKASVDSNNKNAKSLDRIMREAQKAQREMDRLSKAVQKGAITQSQFLGEANKISARLKSLGMAKAQSEVMRYYSSLTRASTGSKMLSTATSELTKEMNRLNVAQSAAGSKYIPQTKRQTSQLGVVFQQAGYQVGDFAVQVQSGTHYMVALGQQLTQLVGVGAMLSKSTKWIAAFSLLGVIVPISTAIIGAFMRANEGAQDAKTSIESLSDAVSAYKDAADKATKSTKDLSKMYGDSADEARELFEINKTLAELDAIDALKESLISLRDEFGDFSNTSVSSLEETISTFDDLGTRINKAGELSDEEFKRANTALEVYRDTVFDLETKLGSTAEEAFQFAIELSKLSQADGPREAVKQLDVVRSLYGQIIGGTENATTAQRELLRQLVNTALEALNLKVNVEGVSSDLSTATSNASSLANEMSRAASEALRFIANLGSGAGLAAAQARVAGLQAELGARQGGAGDVAAAEARARAQAMADPRTQAALQGPVGLRQETLSRIETEVETARLGAIAGQISSQISALGQDTGGTSGAGRDPAEKFNRAKAAVDQLVSSYDEQYAMSLKVEEATRKIEEAQRLDAIPRNMEADQILRDYIASLKDAENPMLDMANTMSNALGDALMSVVDGTKSAKDAFSDMARIIIKKAFEMAVINPILNSIFGGVQGFKLLPTFANGAAFSGGNVIPFANGGVVGGPTAFPMSGGRMGLMGEAGPEAIMPLKRGKDGKLGVVAEGGGGNVTVQNHFHIAANGDDSVKRIIAQEAPKIANLTQKQVLEARSRGGAFRTTFGA